MAYLRGHISNSQINIPVNDTTNLQVNGGIIQIEDEIIIYTTATDTSVLGCTRGANSSVAAAHDDSTSVEPYQDTRLDLYDLPEFEGIIAPEDNSAGILQAPKGSRYTNTVSGKIYIQTGTLAAPEWTEIGAGGGGGLPDGLTFDDNALTIDSDSVIDQLGFFIEESGVVSASFIKNPAGGSVEVANADGAVLIESNGGMVALQADGAIELTAETTISMACEDGITMNCNGLVGNFTGNSNFQMNMGAESIIFSGAGNQYVQFDLETGVRFPIMTTTNRDAITTPLNGMIIVNATTNKINYYSGDSWRATA